MSKKNILFVCLGNICRSLAAEGIFLKKITQKNIQDQFYVDSAGTSGNHDGEHADSRMLEAALKRDITLSSISRKFIDEDLSEFDYIIVMDEQNSRDVKALDKENIHTAKIHLMTDFATGDFKKFSYVPDPYFGGARGFEEVLDLLDNTTEGFLEFVLG